MDIETPSKPPHVDDLLFKDEVYRIIGASKEYVPDFLFFDKIVVEIKAIVHCGPSEEAQIINAIRAAEKPLGLLVNFGEPSLYWKRYANTRPRSD